MKELPSTATGSNCVVVSGPSRPNRRNARAVGARLSRPSGAPSPALGLPAQPPSQPARDYGPSVEAAPLVSEVGELQRDAVVAVLEFGDDGLKVVPFFAGHADLVALDL